MEENQEFCISDPRGMSTIAFMIEEDTVDSETVFTLKLLDKEIEEDGEKTNKTFFVQSLNDAVVVLMVTIGKNKVVMNSGLLQDSELEITKKPDIIKYEPIMNESDDIEFKDFQYTPNLKRPISLIDTETAEEIKPSLYLDPESGDIVGKIKLMPYKSYICIEIRD